MGIATGEVKVLTIREITTSGNQKGDDEQDLAGSINLVEATETAS